MFSCISLHATDKAAAAAAARYHELLVEGAMHWQLDSSYTAWLQAQPTIPGMTVNRTTLFPCLQSTSCALSQIQCIRSLPVLGEARQYAVDNMQHELCIQLAWSGDAWSGHVNSMPVRSSCRSACDSRNHLGVALPVGHLPARNPLS
jgi:hypothetical protein